MRRRHLLCAALLLPWRVVQGAGEESLPATSNLKQLGAESARLKAPIVILFSTPGCPYCLEVRRNYLAPRLAGGNAHTPQILIRELDITSRERVIDFDGRSTTEAEVADRYGVRMVPVVMALDSRGKPIGEPLVGLDRSGFYESYLQTLLTRAQSSMGR
jgi:thioredoxin-related protein